MTTHTDVENQRPAYTEETPLLNEENHEAPEQAEDVPSPTRRYASYPLKLLAALIAIGVTTLFIKGWIDAGSDVDVSFVALCSYRAWKSS